VKGDAHGMSRKTAVCLIVAFVVVAAGFACVAGIRSGMDPTSFTFTTARGDTLEFQGAGVYKYNPRWFAAEGIGWDFATLIVGIPVLLVSALLFVRGSMRGGIVLAGMLAYVAYQYLMYVTGWAYNNLFLLYVALYSLPIVGMVLTVQEMGIDALARRVAVRGPRRGLAGMMFFTAALLLMMWLGKIVPAMLQGEAPEMLNGVHTLIAQALDLGILVPFSLTAGVLLLRRNAWGYVFASVGIVKLLMMALAIVAMVVVRSVVEHQWAWGEIGMFGIIAVVATGFLVALLRSVSVRE
jgi:hypothetical protein